MRRFVSFIGLALAVTACSRVYPEISETVLPEPVTAPTAGPSAKPAKKFSRTPLKRVLLPEDRTVYLYGSVGERTLSVAQQITRLGRSRDPIYLVINSPGGSVLHGATVINAMKAAQGTVITVCTQMCASMAAMIFEYGDERWMMDQSLLMFHPASSMMEGELDKMVSRLSAIQRFIRRIEEHIALRAGLTIDQYKLRAAEEIWLNSEEARAQRFADKTAFIDLPSDRTFADPTEDAIRIRPRYAGPLTTGVWVALRP